MRPFYLVGVVSYQHLDGVHSYLIGNVSRDEANVRATKGELSIKPSCPGSF